MGTHGVAEDVLDAVATIGAVGGNRGRKAGDPALVVGDVSTDIQVETGNKGVAIAQGEFHTAILHLTGIHVHTVAFTHDIEAGHLDENVLCVLVEEVEGAVNLIVEETEVQTGVGLFGAFPFEVVITDTVSLETGGEAALVGTLDIVGSSTGTTVCTAVVLGGQPAETAGKVAQRLL